MNVANTVEFPLAQPDPLAEEPFINKPTVAQRMANTTTRSVEHMMASGLPHYKLGRRVLFRWSEIQSYLAQTCRVCRRA